jgi:hypothetical protein
MIEAIFVALFQAAAGAPETPPAEPVEATAAQEQTVAQAEPQPAAAPQEQLICHREPVLGSRIKRRVCLTAAEQQVLTDESRDQIHRMQSQIPQQGN